MLRAVPKECKGAASGKAVRSPQQSRSAHPHFCTNAARLRIAAAEASTYAARMPSMVHEMLVALFRNRPALAVDLLRVLAGAELPPFAEARVGSADFTDINPAQYHADLVVML